MPPATGARDVRGAPARGALLALAAARLSLCAADRAEDLVTELPGFPDASSWGFRAYSGFLHVPGPISSYDALSIHYQFHTSQGHDASDPVVAWHQGGPGGSSIAIGLYSEMGAFQVGDGEKYLNPFAWNRVANMLYLESPAGSGGDSGFSTCLRGEQAVPCSWDDVSQAEAYAHTLLAFFQAFPEYAGNDFYLSGESYFGQYGPNIAHFILQNEPFNTRIRLRGIAAGNACWGGTETCVACNGPSRDKVSTEFYFGKGLYSPELKRQIDANCDFPTDYIPSAHGGPFACDAGAGPGEKCAALLGEMERQVGPHNIYDVYDNCASTARFLARVGRDAGWLLGVLRSGLHNVSATRQALRELNGGYDWDCGGDIAGWMAQPAVAKALHLDGATPGASRFSYNCSGPASITLWPRLSQQLRVLIYNGDADACVPYNGNEEWVGMLEQRGILQQTAPWTPWYFGPSGVPRGYVTGYTAPGSGLDFSFATVRLAGHMAPRFQPEASFALISRFLAGGRAGAGGSERLVV